MGRAFDVRLAVGHTYQAAVRRLRPRKVYTDTAGTLLVSLVSQVALVGSGVSVARILGVTDRGRLALIILCATIVTQLGSLGMPIATTYWLARNPDGTPDLIRALRGFVARQVPLLISLQAIVLWVVLGSAPMFEKVAAVTSLVGTPALILWQYWLGVLQGQRRFMAWNITRLINPVLYPIAVTVLYVSGAGSLEIIVVSWSASLWVSALAAAVVARKIRADHSTQPRRPPEIRRMLRFGLKALLGSVSPLQAFNLDQAVVGLFISPAALGIYVVAVSFTNLPFFIAQAVGGVAYPTIAAGNDLRQVRRTIAATFVFVLGIGGVIVAAISIALPRLVPFFFGAAFTPAVGVARILLVYGLLVGLRRILGDCARGAGHPILSTIDEIAALVSLIPAILLLVGRGTHGVAWAMVISASAGLLVVLVGLAWALGRPARRLPRLATVRRVSPSSTHPASVEPQGRPDGDSGGEPLGG